jgi:hypothetical protein
MGAAGAAAAVAAAALLVLHRRRRAVRSDKAGAADVSDESSDSFEPSKPWDVERGGGRPGHGGPSIADSARPSTEGALSAPALSGSAGSRAGSDGSGPVVLPSRRGSSRALPDLIGGTLTREQAASIQLGTLVGVGSFGRVFRGSLGGQEYAIKVIHHNRAAAKAVTNEVALTMGFDHRNLVRGRHYLTWGSAGVSHMTRPEVGCLLGAGGGGVGGRGESSATRNRFGVNHCPSPQPRASRAPAKRNLARAARLRLLPAGGHEPRHDAAERLYGRRQQRRRQRGRPRGLWCAAASAAAGGDLDTGGVL